MGLRDDAAEVEKIGGPSDWFNKTGAWEPEPAFVRLPLDEFQAILKAQWETAQMIGMARGYLRQQDFVRALAARASETNGGNDVAYYNFTRTPTDQLKRSLRFHENDTGAEDEGRRMYLIKEIRAELQSRAKRNLGICDGRI